MQSWRAPAVLLLLLTASVSVRAQATLSETVKPGECSHYTITMDLSGEMRFRKDSGQFTTKLKAQATHTFPERAMSGTALIDRSVRIYETAKVSIERGSDRSEVVLRPGRKLVVAQRSKDQLFVYSPNGPLTRGELDLLSGHFDTLSLMGLLPGKDVKVGETWKIAANVAQALCGLEGATENKLEGKLESVANDTARFSVTGKVAGVEQGAVINSVIEATGAFDLKARRLVSLDWGQKSERDQGPVSPASSIALKIKVVRKKIDQPAELSDLSLVSVPRDNGSIGRLADVEYRDSKGRFNLVHGREWRLTGVTADHTVLRLLDGGEYIAQVTVTPWTKARKGEHMEPEQFKKAMNNATGWKPERELQAGVVPAEGGRWVYRLSTLGELNGVQVLQTFYLVAGPSGEQVLLTFTMSPKAADKLGVRDLTMAAAVEVPAAEEKK